MEGRCLDCHKGVAWLVERDRGLHGRPGLGECASCHPEHAGADFQLVEWSGGGPDDFDHGRTGWALKGAHARLQCVRCHQEKFRSSPSAELSPGKETSRSWLGLETGCASCHEDIHRGSLGDECSGCHTSFAWRPARGFDHARTSFPLSGRHSGLACGKCHLASHLELTRDDRGKPVPLYKPLPHQECAACHADPHQARLGTACSSCHTADSFKTVTTASFDHGRTRYPLEGAHRKVACERCHRSGEKRVARPASGACTSCHADPHAGRATLGGKAVDCADCHAVDGWTRPAFTVARHASTSYPLEGRHADVACGKCHGRQSDREPAVELGKAGVRIHPAHDHCADCHGDAHAGQLAGRSSGSACEPCHSVEGWKPSRFAAADHAGLALALDGAHRKAACSACHGPQRPGLPPLPDGKALGTARVALRLEERACGQCHADPHQGRYRAEKSATASSACLPCHTTESFRPATLGPAEHARFAFALEGAHRAVPCLECHEALGGEAGASSLVRAGAAHRDLTFSRGRSRCEECHRGPHGEQFASRGGDGCASCHTAASWKPAAGFNHDRDTTFALKGSHARVPCARCHPGREAEGGAVQVVYRLTKTRCRDCHEPGLLKAGAAGS